MTVSQYFEAMRGKRILVLGLGVSNRPLVRLLLQHGIDVTACDKTPREQLDEEVLQLERQGAHLRLGAQYLDDLSGDIVFRTPGMHPNTPEILQLRAQGARVTSEMEAFFAVCPCHTIGVTGSDGKSTTSTILSELLKAQGKRVWLGGNIGKPLLDCAEQMQREDWAVLELSSFQLMDMPFSPEIAIVTNLAPNHLDIHRDMQEYIEAKENVFLHQKEDGVLVLNADNAITAGFAPLARGHVRLFSRETEPEHGVFFRDGVVYRKRGEQITPILRREEILLPGLHNVENYMAAIAATEGIVSDEAIRAVAGRFGGVEHRIELVRIKDGVSYYNDSIASSPSRTIAGLRSFDRKVILIAGGYDKHIPYDVLGPEIVSHVKTLICTGDTGGKIKAATMQAPEYSEGHPRILEIDDFREAVCAASTLAKPGDVVLLSPASAAFDRFKNFMVRGKTFKKIVMEL